MTPPPVRPPWYDPTMPTAERSVLRYMLEGLANSDPDGLCLQFADGDGGQMQAAVVDTL